MNEEIKRLQEYLNRKYEALHFWTDLRDVMPLEQKIALLKSQIEEAKKTLEGVKL